MSKEEIDVVWARTAERTWSLDGPRQHRVDGRTLRERLDIPRDGDDDGDSPLLTHSAGPHQPSAPEVEAAGLTPPRGSLEIAADRVIDTGARRVLVTDARDRELAHHAADALVEELRLRDVTAAHLHVGRAEHGETPLAGSMDQVDEFVSIIAAGGHQGALATGGGDPDMVSATIDRLLAGVDRVVLTGTGTGLDQRQARLADLAEAVVVRDEHQVFDPHDADELLDQHTPIVAILQGLPVTVDEPEPPPSRRVPLAVLVAGGVLAVAALIGAGWYLYQAATDDETDVAEPPTTAAAPSPTTAPPSVTDTAPPATGAGGIDIGIVPDLVAAPTVIFGDTVSLQGAVRTEEKAARMLAAAEILADGGDVDDQLVVDPDAARWTIVRIERPLAGMRDGNQFSAAGQLWADAIEQLVPTTEARVALWGGTSDDGPRPIAGLLAGDLLAKGFDPVVVRAIAPGTPPALLEAEVESPES